VGREYGVRKCTPGKGWLQMTDFNGCSRVCGVIGRKLAKRFYWLHLALVDSPNNIGELRGFVKVSTLQQKGGLR
jgi:hypothetical protein